MKILTFESLVVILAFLVFGKLNANEGYELICDTFYEFNLEKLHPEWNKTGIVKTCQAFTMNIQNPDTEIVSIKPMYPLDKPSFVAYRTKIESIHITSLSKVMFMPKGFKNENIMPTLKMLLLKEGNLQELKNSDLKQFGDDLIYLNLRGNKISSLDADLFEHNPNLEYVDLSENPLEYIEPGFFKNMRKMKNLAIVRFENAGCMNQAISSSSHDDIVIKFWDFSKCTNETSLEDIENILQDIHNKTQQGLDNGANFEKKLDISVQEINSSSERVEKNLKRDLIDVKDLLGDLLVKRIDEESQGPERYIWIIIFTVSMLLSTVASTFITLKKLSFNQKSNSQVESGCESLKLMMEEMRQFQRNFHQTVLINNENAGSGYDRNNRILNLSTFNESHC